jgi:putative DNA primase/helicase
MMVRGQQSPGNPAGAGLPGWFDQVQVNDKGVPLAILSNAKIALSLDPVFVGCFRFDKFRSEVMVCAPLPWEPLLRSPRQWSERDRLEVTIWLQDNYLRVGEMVAQSAAFAVAYDNTFNPPFDYIAGIEDQPERGVDLTTWLITYCGADDTPYVRAVGRKWMLSAVARLFYPGCQVDCVLVLEGAEGIGKSSAFAILGGEFYSNDLTTVGTKDSQQQLGGKWIIETDELDGMRRAEWPAAKAFFSRRVDYYRRAYRRDVEEIPRQCVFCGTTNKSNWIPEPEGARRFWPVRCTNIDLVALRRDRDQLWVQARNALMSGETWYISDDKIIDFARNEQRARLETDPWEDDISKALVKNQPITTNDIFNILRIEPRFRGRAEQMRIGAILRLLGWAKRQARRLDNLGKSERVWLYYPPDWVDKPD